MKKSGQEMVAQTRAPRVQISYDVELVGEINSVELPFVMGVMADLSGHDSHALPPLGERNFIDVEASTFNSLVNKISPSLSLSVKNKLTNDGNFTAELTFTKFDDFQPDEVARKIPAVNKLIEARERLTSLLTYMDGKNNAQKLIKEIIDNKDVLKMLANTKIKREDGVISDHQDEE